jgi:acetylornithine/succinyldiaminopimelate/putrescine aminotransferase/predicted amino acid dehydrogenase
MNTNVATHGIELNPERERLMRFAGLARRFMRAEGVWLFDETGRRFLDCYGQYGALALGHNHAAVKEALRGALDSNVPAMVQPYAPVHAEVLARELYALTGGHFSRCVFTTSGAETVEVAIKLARMRSGRPIVLSAAGSYHGKTMGALAASDRLDFSRQHHQPPHGFARVKYGDVDALAKFFEDHGHECAGFIVEPIQGERGVFEPPRGYLAAARRLCDQHGVALIADEIQTGLFRTGSAFACDHEHVAPDMLLMAKALGGGVFPLGACLVNATSWEPGFALTHSSTFANNNLASIVALAVLRELRKSAFQQNLANVAALLEAGFADLAHRYPQSVQAVRGRGLMRAIELREPHADAGYFLNYLHQQRLAAFLYASTIAENHGVLVLPVLNDSNVVRIAPPLVTRPEHITALLTGLDDTLHIWEGRSAHRVVRSLLQRPGPVESSPGHIGNQGPSTLRRIDLPHYRARVSHGIDYAFIIHPTTVDDILLNDPTFCELTVRELERYCDFSAQLPAGVVCHVPEIVSLRGNRVRGALIGLPLLPAQMADRGREDVITAIAAAVDLARDRGARVVGLGAYTSIYTRKGIAVIGRGPAITTGNLLTAGMTVKALQWVLQIRGMAVGDLCVGIVGARGSVGALVAQLIARDSPREILLIGNPQGDVRAIGRIADRLTCLGDASVATTRDLAMIEKCDVVVSASSSPRAILDDVYIRAGTIICDVARPYDASEALRSRRDITVIDAGLVQLPGTVGRIGIGNLQGYPAGVALACMSETILLALAEVTRDYGVGDDVGVEDVDTVLDLAVSHGFTLATQMLPSNAHSQGLTLSKPPNALSRLALA